MGPVRGQASSGACLGLGQGGKRGNALAGGGWKGWNGASLALAEGIGLWHERLAVEVIRGVTLNEKRGPRRKKTTRVLN